MARTRPRRLTFGVLVLIIAAGRPVIAQSAGIAVGTPKVFDDRTLELMLQDLDAQLAALRVLNQEKVATGLGQLQGSQLRSVERSGQLSQLPVAAVERTSEANAEGGVVPKSETTTQSAFAPAPPSLGDAQAFAAPLSSYGLQAQDLLSEQISLQYQAFNLRMLLNRSLTDRFYDGGTSNRGARLHALLGFQISLDPRREHRSSVAVVEIEVEPFEASKARPSLVALMPQEKVYNALSVSKKSNAFGGAGVASVFTLGYSERRRGETFYVYRDADTFAFERPTTSTEPKALTFGWQFRPVLGRPSVEPGIRQLFAVVALDEMDSGDPDATDLQLKVTATTHWVKYDAKKRLPKSSPRHPRTQYRSEILRVPHSAKLQDGLTPKVESVEVVPLSGDDVLVKIKGANFFPDTSVSVGPRTLQPGSSAFVIRSRDRLQFVANAAELLENEVTLTGGRFGFPALVTDPAGDDASGIALQLGRGRDRRAGYTDLLLFLSDPKNPKVSPELHSRDVFVLLGDDSYVLPFERWAPAAPAEPRVLQASLEVPVTLLARDLPVEVVVPFLGSHYRVAATYHPPVEANEVVLLEAGDPTVWGIVGHGFTDAIVASAVVYAGRELTLGNGLEHPFAPGDPRNLHLLELRAPKSELEKVREVTVSFLGQFEPQVLRAPTVPKPKTSPTPTATVATSVTKGSSGRVSFQGTHLDQIESVEFGSQKLVFVAESATRLVVVLTRDVTKESGPVTLLGRYADGRFLSLDFVVQ